MLRVLLWALWLVAEGGGLTSSSRETTPHVPTEGTAIEK